MKKEILERIAYQLKLAFIEINNTPSDRKKPYITRKQIIHAYERFMKSRGRYEWETEAIKKALLGCGCPVDFYYGSGLSGIARTMPNPVYCDKCRPYFILINDQNNT